MISTALNDVLLRVATPDDVVAMAVLDRAIFEEAWSEKAFRHGVGGDGWHVIVAEESDRIVGYGLAWTVVDESEIARLAVAEESRGRGIGQALLRALLETCMGHGARDIFLEVRHSNAAALALYERAGFDRIGRRRRYYHNNEDAVTMRYRVAGYD